MKKEIGLWIDHRKAVAVIVSDEVREITSHMEKHVRYSNDYSEGGSSENMQIGSLGIALTLLRCCHRRDL